LRGISSCSKREAARVSGGADAGKRCEWSVCAAESLLRVVLTGVWGVVQS
jgi:hypothetical protein